MAAKKFGRLIAGILTEVFGVQLSTGAANAGDIPALNDDGKIDVSMMPWESNFRAPFYCDEFLNTTAAIPWSGAAISSGSNSNSPSVNSIVPSRPGVVLLRSSTNANSGYRYMTSNWSFLLGGGEESNFIASANSASGTGKIRFGWQDSLTSSSPTDAAVFNINGDGSVSASCWNNGSETTNSTAFTDIDKTLFYRFNIKIATGGASVTFSIYSMAGSLIEQRTISTGIPTSTGRATGHGVVVWDTGTTASDICFADYLDVSLPGLARG